MTGYHAFIDKSKRKPYQCGVCGRDITSPYHQPLIPGTAYVPPVREPEPEEEEVVYVPKPRPQLTLF